MQQSEYSDTQGLLAGNETNLNIENVRSKEMIAFYEKQNDVHSSAISEKLSKREKTIEVIEDKKLKKVVENLLKN